MERFKVDKVIAKKALNSRRQQKNETADEYHIAIRDLCDQYDTKMSDEQKLDCLRGGLTPSFMEKMSAQNNEIK